MKLRHILWLGAVALLVCLTLVGQASARHLNEPSVASQTSQPSSSYYTPAALKAQGLRMQAMVRAYERSSTSVGGTSNGFDLSDGLIGAGVGLGITVGAAGLFLAVMRARRLKLAL